MLEDTNRDVLYSLAKEEDGASAAEYALLLAVITLGIVGAMTVRMFPLLLPTLPPV